MKLIYTHAVLTHGSTIALQLMQNDFWFGCSGVRCAGSQCPGVFFEGTDWTHCWGEVFRMYRAAGRGHILNGDFVGLHYIRENRWFSMFQSYGRKLTCPGSPSATYGFQNFQKWLMCGSEVFRVYAKGKPYRAPITDQDTISLFFPSGKQHVVFRTNGVVLSRCMLERSGYSQTPSNRAYDECKYMSVEITIR